MAILKCKMCGGDLTLLEGKTTAECEYCGSVQTVPVVDDEKKLTLFNRANRLRFACEFDKAAGVYESIVAEFPEEAEAYWGLLLCKFGIEYVDDPKTGKKIPTCHRSSFESVLDDSDFELVMEYSDVVSRAVYRAEAKAIEELCKRIIEVSSKEEPHDIFICYKETDENGDRTLDSVIAQDVYTELTEKGYRVFFSRISLEDKLGVEYEPYIFAALNSAKIMLVFGTDYEYFNAVWVKNEWSRFLQLIAAGQKKTLIPCYKNIDAYDMPKEFARLQAQDMGKVGAMQDLLRGIEKILPKKQKCFQIVQENLVDIDIEAFSAAKLMASQLNRGNEALEKSDWKEAYRLFKIVTMRNGGHPAMKAQAYLGMFLATQQVRNTNEFVSKYLNEAKNAETKILTVPLPQERIDELAQRYAVGDYLNETTIKSSFDHFDNCYESQLPARVHLQQLLKDDQCLKEAQKFNPKLVLQMLELTEDGLQRLIEEAKLQDDVAVEQICQRFETYYAEQEAKIAACYKACLRALAQKAEAVIHIYDIKYRLPRLHAELEKTEKELQAAKETVEGLLHEKLDVFDEELETRMQKRKRERDEVEAELQPMNIEIEQRRKALSELGVFQGKEKRELKRRIHELEEKCAPFQTKYNAAKHEFEALCAFKETSDRQATVEQACADIVQKSSGYDTCDLRTAIRYYVQSNRYQVIPEVEALWREMNASVIAASSVHVVGLKTDGGVCATGFNKYGPCDVYTWKDNFVSVAAGYHFTVGLKTDGTVLTTGSNRYSQCETADWTDVVAIAAGGYHTVGLKADGTVAATGLTDDDRCNVSSWTDIVAISAGGADTAGLRADGSVFLTGEHAYQWRASVSSWTDIVAIAISGGKSSDHIIGLRADGTVVVAGRIDYDRWDVSSWTDIVAIAAGRECAFGLKPDGTLSLSGASYGLRDVATWRNITAISACDSNIFGLKSNGTMIVAGGFMREECDVSVFRDIKNPWKH